MNNKSINSVEVTKKMKVSFNATIVFALAVVFLVFLIPVISAQTTSVESESLEFASVSDLVFVENQGNHPSEVYYSGQISGPSVQTKGLTEVNIKPVPSQTPSPSESSSIVLPTHSTPLKATDAPETN